MFFFYLDPIGIPKNTLNLLPMAETIVSFNSIICSKHLSRFVFVSNRCAIKSINKKPTSVRTDIQTTKKVSPMNSKEAQPNQRSSAHNGVNMRAIEIRMLGNQRRALIRLGGWCCCATSNLAGLFKNQVDDTDGEDIARHKRRSSKCITIFGVTFRVDLLFVHDLFIVCQQDDTRPGRKERNFWGSAEMLSLKEFEWENVAFKESLFKRLFYEA